MNERPGLDTGQFVGSLSMVAPDAGLYLVAALGPPGDAAPFVLSPRTD